MKRLLMICLLVGCGGVAGLSDDRFSTADRDAITVGMSKADVEAKLGKPTTVVISIGEMEGVQWVRGEDDTTSSLSVNYINGKVDQVIGTNLK